jgi:hypothetical protein
MRALESTYFLTLSAGIPIPQNTNDASPPEKKLAVPVPIWIVCYPYPFKKSWVVQILLQKVSLLVVKSNALTTKKKNQDVENLREVENTRTSIDKNIHKKLLRKARLPVKPVHSPSTPCARTVWRAQSMGPLN